MEVVRRAIGPKHDHDLRTRMTRSAYRVTLLAVLVTAAASPLHPQRNQLADSAQAAYAKRDFTTAIPYFLLASQAEPETSGEHLFHAACCFARTGQTDLAFASLGVAVAKGWYDGTTTEETPDLVTLYNDPRWNEMLVRVKTGRMIAHRTAIVQALKHLMTFGYQYKIRPRTMGGGHGSFAGLTLPPKLEKDVFARYEIPAATANNFRLQATSAAGFGTVGVDADIDGQPIDWYYTGAFADSSGEGIPKQSVIAESRTDLINDLNRIANHTFRFRMASAQQGGGGAYTGLVLPDTLRSNAHGIFTFTVVGPDEVRFCAISRTVSGAAMEVTIDRDGRFNDWRYFGSFREP